MPQDPTPAELQARSAFSAVVLLHVGLAGVSNILGCPGNRPNSSPNRGRFRGAGARICASFVAWAQLVASYNLANVLVTDGTPGVSGLHSFWVLPKWARAVVAGPLAEALARAVPVIVCLSLASFHSMDAALFGLCRSACVMFKVAGVMYVSIYIFNDQLRVLIGADHIAFLSGYGGPLKVLGIELAAALLADLLGLPGKPALGLLDSYRASVQLADDLSRGPRAASSRRPAPTAAAQTELSPELLDRLLAAQQNQHVVALVEKISDCDELISSMLADLESADCEADGLDAAVADLRAADDTRTELTGLLLACLPHALGLKGTQGNEDDELPAELPAEPAGWDVRAVAALLLVLPVAEVCGLPWAGDWTSVLSAVCHGDLVQAARLANRAHRDDQKAGEKRLAEERAEQERSSQVLMGVLWLFRAVRRRDSPDRDAAVVHLRSIVASSPPGHFLRQPSPGSASLRHIALVRMHGLSTQWTLAPVVQRCLEYTASHHPKAVSNAWDMRSEQLAAAHDSMIQSTVTDLGQPGGRWTMRMSNNNVIHRLNTIRQLLEAGPLRYASGEPVTRPSDLRDLLMADPASALLPGSTFVLEGLEQLTNVKRANLGGLDLLPRLQSASRDDYVCSLHDLSLMVADPAAAHAAALQQLQQKHTQRQTYSKASKELEIAHMILARSAQHVPMITARLTDVLLGPWTNRAWSPFFSLLPSLGLKCPSMSAMQAALGVAQDATPADMSAAASRWAWSAASHLVMLAARDADACIGGGGALSVQQFACSGISRLPALHRQLTDAAAAAGHDLGVFRGSLEQIWSELQLEPADPAAVAAAAAAAEAAAFQTAAQLAELQALARSKQQQQQGGPKRRRREATQREEEEEEEVQWDSCRSSSSGGDDDGDDAVMRDSEPDALPAAAAAAAAPVQDPAARLAVTRAARRAAGSAAAAGAAAAVAVPEAAAAGDLIRDARTQGYTLKPATAERLLEQHGSIAAVIATLKNQ